MAVETALNAPPVAVAAFFFLGLSLPEWAAVVAIIYTLALLFFRTRREIRETRLFRERHVLPPADTEGDA